MLAIKPGVNGRDVELRSKGRFIARSYPPQDKRRTGVKFTEPPEQIKKEIAALKADKTVSEAEKKDELAELEAALKTAKPIQFKENIALVLKHYDRLLPLMQEPGRG